MILRPGIQTGVPWEMFLESLVSTSSDGGSDFYGRFTGFRGRIQRATTFLCNSYWCSNHKFDLNTKDLSENPDIEVFR